jgi:hypothetical protein
LWILFKQWFINGFPARKQQWFEWFEWFERFEWLEWFKRL